MNPTEIHCNIGEAKAGRAGSTLRATLGSCIGIATPWPARGRSIGRKNGEAALRILGELGIRIAHLDLGGHLGRRIEIDCENHSFKVHRIENGTEAA